METASTEDADRENNEKRQADSDNQHPVTTNSLQIIEKKYIDMLNAQEQKFNEKLEEMEKKFDTKLKDIETRHCISLIGIVAENTENLRTLYYPLTEQMQRLLLTTQTLTNSMEILKNDVENLELDIEELTIAENESGDDAN